MSLHSDVIQFLIGLGTDAESRVHDDEVPQKVPFPFIATGLSGSTQPNALNGTKLFARAQIRVAIFGRSAIERDGIATQIKAGFDTWKAANRKGGLLGDTRVISISITRSSDEVPLSDGDNQIKGAALDLSFMYQE